MFIFLFAARLLSMVDVDESTHQFLHRMVDGIGCMIMLAVNEMDFVEPFSLVVCFLLFIFCFRW